MKKVGLIGWRGMVGSVLLQRMHEEDDFSKIEPYFFSTSQAGLEAPHWSKNTELLGAYDTEALLGMDIIISCQGGGYTEKIHPQLRNLKWKGHWIDAASTLRMSPDAIITLDPINNEQILKGLHSGVKDFIGSNCTVSLMLLALGGLFKEDLVEWMTSQTYQAASGAGAKNMQELLHQMKYITQQVSEDLSRKSSILTIDQKVTESLKHADYPDELFGTSLAANLIPWIDKAVEKGQTKEEQKGFNETNKILGRTQSPIPVDGTCVRVSSMRCHSQAFTIKLKKSVSLSTIENIIADHNPWVELIENNKEQTLKHLTPKNVTGTLKIPIGRVRKLNIGDTYLNAFSVGDQLLWGAAEPLRRTLNILIKNT